MDNEPLLLRAFRQEPLSRPPVWLMRQAGRYMAEYRDLKAKHSFLDLCRKPQLAIEVSMQPIRYLDVDAAIIFSDILIPLEGMGLSVDFNPGPYIANPVRGPQDVERIVVPKEDPNRFVYDAVAGLRAELAQLSGERKALLGFAGAPWTLACYAIDRGSYKHFESAQIFATEHPRAMHLLLEKFATVVSSYLCAQITAGADVVQLFDSWGGNLARPQYEDLSLPYLTQIIRAVHANGGKVILYVGNSNHLLPSLSASEADAVSVDWRVNMKDARLLLGDSVVIQGNLDPTLLFGGIDSVRDRTKEMLRRAPQRGYIANLGHGILQTTPPENARAFVETIRSFSSAGGSDD